MLLTRRIFFYQYSLYPKLQIFEPERDIYRYKATVLIGFNPLRNEVTSAKTLHFTCFNVSSLTF